MELKLVVIHNELVKEIKRDIERDVELVKYRAEPREAVMYCHLHMKNGMIIEGTGAMPRGGKVEDACDSARRNALRLLILIEQYILADDLYVEALCGCGENDLRPKEK